MQLVPFGYCGRRLNYDGIAKAAPDNFIEAIDRSRFWLQIYRHLPFVMCDTHTHPPSMDKVSGFPYLTVDEFVEACNHIQPLLPDSAVLAGESACLRITRRLAAASDLEADGQEQLDSTIDTPDDHDEEAIIKSSQESSFVNVNYDVLLSPSYRVPVVYMTASPPLPLSHFFDLVVPHHFRDVMREVGVMGALSMTVIVDPVEAASPADFVLAGPSSDGFASILCTSLSHCRCDVCHAICRCPSPGLYACLARDCWSKRGPKCFEHRTAPCMIQVVYSSSLSSMASSSISIGASSSFPSSLSSLGRFTPAV